MANIRIQIFRRKIQLDDFKFQGFKLLLDFKGLQTNAILESLL